MRGILHGGLASEWNDQSSEEKRASVEAISIESLVVTVPQARPTKSNRELLRFFSAHPEMPAVAVTAEDETLLGLVDRDRFRNLFLLQYGHALYTRRHVGAVMTVDPLVVSPNASVLETYRRAVSRPMDRRMECLPVLEGNRLLGVVVVSDLMTRVAEIQEQMLARLAELQEREHTALEWERRAKSALENGIGEVVMALRRHADGDLTRAPGGLEHLGPLKEVSEAVEATREQLARIVLEISSALQKMEKSLAANQEVVAAVESGASDQEEQVKKLQSTFDGISAAAEKGAEASREATSGFAELRAVGQDGMMLVQETLDHLKRMTLSVERSTGTLDALEATMGEASRITDVIADLAERSDVVALNASILAAHAGGTAGAAFGVLAHELRELSAEMSEHNFAVAQILGKIGGDVATLLAGSRESLAIAGLSRSAVEKARSGLDRTATALEGGNALLREFSSKIEGQREQVGLGLKSVREVAEQAQVNRRHVQSARENARSVSEGLGALRTAEARFRLG